MKKHLLYIGFVILSHIDRNSRIRNCTLSTTEKQQLHA